METKERAGRNRTLTVFPDEIEPLRKQITSIDGLKSRKDYLNKTINGRWASEWVIPMLRQRTGRISAAFVFR